MATPFEPSVNPLAAASPLAAVTRFVEPLARSSCAPPTAAASAAACMRVLTYSSYPTSIPRPRNDSRTVRLRIMVTMTYPCRPPHARTVPLTAFMALYASTLSAPAHPANRVPGFRHRVGFATALCLDLAGIHTGLSRQVSCDRVGPLPREVEIILVRPGHSS